MFSPGVSQNEVVTVPQFKISSGTCNKNQATGGAFVVISADGTVVAWGSEDYGSESSAKISSCFCRYLWYDLRMQQPLTFENRMARVLWCDLSTKESQSRLHFDIQLQSFQQANQFVYSIQYIYISTYKYLIILYIYKICIYVCIYI